MQKNEKFRQFSEADIERLRVEITPYIDDSRMAHVLAVEEEAAYLGEKLGFSFNDILRLRAAALLHDITKKADLKKQLKYAEEFDIIFSDSQMLSPEVIHAVTGAPFSEKYFSDFTDAGILSAIRQHTTGRYGMTDFESVIYLSDVTEKTRTHKNCRLLRDKLHGGIEASLDDVSKKKIFYDCMIQSFDSTIEHLLSKCAAIDTDTVAARNYFIEYRAGMDTSAKKDV